MNSDFNFLDELKTFEGYTSNEYKLPTIKFIEHRPSYFTGFENKEYELDDISQVLDLEFVKNFSKSGNFYGYFITYHDTNDLNKPLKLMALYNWSDEYNGCQTWVVLGYLYNVNMALSGLKYWGDFQAKHKPNCWIRKYRSCEDLFGHDRPFNQKMKIAKELGWWKEDFMGIAVECDCGFDKK